MLQAIGRLIIVIASLSSVRCRTERFGLGVDDWMVVLDARKALFAGDGDATNL